MRSLLSLTLLLTALAAPAARAQGNDNVEWARDRYSRGQNSYTGGQRAQGQKLVAEARAFALAAARANPSDERARHILKLINDWEKEKRLPVPEQAEIDALLSGATPHPGGTAGATAANTPPSEPVMKGKIAAPPGWNPGRASQVPGLGPIAFIDVGPDSAQIEQAFVQNRALTLPLDRIARARLFTQPQATRLFVNQTMTVFDQAGMKITDLPAGEEVVAFQFLPSAGVRILTADGLEGLFQAQYLEVERPAGASLPAYPRQLSFGGRSQDLTQQVAASEPAYKRLQAQLADCVGTAQAGDGNCGTKYEPLLKKVEDDARKKALETTLKNNRVARGYSAPTRS